MSVEIITVPLGFNQCYVLKDGGVVVVDAGQPGMGDSFTRALGTAAINRSDVKLVILTHGHWDHVGSANEIRTLTGAALAMHCSEARGLERSPTPLSPGITPWGKVFYAVHRLFLPFIKLPAIQVDIAFDDDGLALGDFGIPGRVIHTPGHSAGSATVLLDTGEAFVGDLAMNRFPLRLSPGLPIFADDPAAVIRSWMLLIELGAKTVYPAHGQPFPVEIIEGMITRGA